MSYDLTGQKVSFTYGNLLQYVDGSFYNGFGVPVPIADVSSLTQILAGYTPNSSLGGSFYWDSSGFLEVSIGPTQTGVFVQEASLSSDFYWDNGFLYVDVSIVAGGVGRLYVDGSLNDIRSKYIPDSSLGSESFYWDASNYLQTSTGGGAGLVGKWKYDNATSDVDPGNGYFRLNNADPSLATFVYVSDFTSPGVNVINILKTLKPGDRFYIQQLPSAVDYGVYRLTSQVIDAVNYVKFPVIAENASGSFTKNKESGFLFLYTSGTQPSVVDPSLDYQTYVPRVSDVSFYYDLNANVTNIRSQSDIGLKTVDFVYNDAGDVSIITINNYGLNQKQVTFESDPYGNIIAVHIA